MAYDPEGFWECPKCGDLNAVIKSKCSCGYDRNEVQPKAPSSNRSINDSIKTKPVQLTEYAMPSDCEFVKGVFYSLSVVCWIGGFILGITLGKDRYGTFSFTSALAWWAAFFAGGVIYIAIAKAIEYLHTIALNTGYTARNAEIIRRRQE